MQYTGSMSQYSKRKTAIETGSIGALEGREGVGRLLTRFNLRRLSSGCKLFGSHSERPANKLGKKNGQVLVCAELHQFAWPVRNICLC